jgi:hypothetical protein
LQLAAISVTKQVASRIKLYNGLADSAHKLSMHDQKS